MQGEPLQDGQELSVGQVVPMETVRLAGWTDRHGQRICRRRIARDSVSGTGEETDRRGVRGGWLAPSLVIPLGGFLDEREAPLHSIPDRHDEIHARESGGRRGYVRPGKAFDHERRDGDALPAVRVLDLLDRRRRKRMGDDLRSKLSRVTADANQDVEVTHDADRHH